MPEHHDSTGAETRRSPAIVRTFAAARHALRLEALSKRLAPDFATCTSVVTKSTNV